MKKVLTWLFVLALIVGGVMGIRWYLQQQAVTEAGPEILRTADVVHGDLILSVPASGSVAVKEQRELFFSRTGIVTEIAVQENDRVTAGQTLATLGTVDLERAVRNAEIALEQAQLTLKQRQQPVDEADLELAQLSVQSAAQTLEAARLGKITARADADAMVVDAQRARENAFKDYHARQDTPEADPAYDKYEILLEQETIAGINADLIIEQADDQWLAAYNRYQQAQRSLARLEQGPDEIQVQQAELQVTQAQLNLDQAKANLKKAVLVAPMDGLIAASNVQLDQPTPSQYAAFTLVDDSEFYVDVMVDEMDIGEVNLDQTVSINLDAYPDTLITGTVSTIAPASTNVGGIISYKVRVRLTETGDVDIRAQMTANVTIYTGELIDLTLIPNWAIRTDQENNSIYTYRLTGDQVERVNLTLGERNDTSTQVLTGLELGDTVALITEERNFGPPDQ